jgi:hypothetical protein
VNEGHLLLVDITKPVLRAEIRPSKFEIIMVRGMGDIKAKL